MDPKMNKILPLYLMGAIFTMLLAEWGSDLKGYELKALMAQPQPLATPTGLLTGPYAGGKVVKTAVNSMYGKSSPSIEDQIVKLFPALKSVYRVCPVSDCGSKGKAPLNHLIVHLNDGHMWSREKIADWLEVIAIDDPSVDLTLKITEDDNGRDNTEAA